MNNYTHSKQHFSAGIGKPSFSNETAELRRAASSTGRKCVRSNIALGASSNAAAPSLLCAYQYPLFTFLEDKKYWTTLYNGAERRTTTSYKTSLTLLHMYFISWECIKKNRMFQKNDNESVQVDTVQWLAPMAHRMKVVGSIPGLRVCMFSHWLCGHCGFLPQEAKNVHMGLKTLNWLKVQIVFFLFFFF